MLIQNPALLYKNVYELCKQASMPGQSWRAFNCAKDKYVSGCNKLNTLVKEALQILYMSNTLVELRLQIFFSIWLAGVMSARINNSKLTPDT